MYVYVHNYIYFDRKCLVHTCMYRPRDFFKSIIATSSGGGGGGGGGIRRALSSLLE